MHSARGETLRRQVADAPDDKSRLAALLALAAFYVGLADGAKGLAVASEARTLALQRADFAAAANALNSASVSQFHRSEYLGALAAAMDAWDYAKRSDSLQEIAVSHVSVGLALLALGASGMAMKVINKGLTLAADSESLLEPRIRLIRLKGMLIQMTGTMDQAEELFREAVRLSERANKAQLATSYANWGIALLRTSEMLDAQGTPDAEMLTRSRAHSEMALRLAEEENDVPVVTDRIASLGKIAFLEGRLDDAENLLVVAMDRARALDYVRTQVVASVDLAKLYLRRRNYALAVRVLRDAVTQARRGAADDILASAATLLADALEKVGSTGEAAEFRSVAIKLRHDNDLDRHRAVEDATRFAERILGT